MKNRPEFSAAEDSSVLETSFKPNPPKFEIQLPKKKKSQQKKKGKIPCCGASWMAFGCGVPLICKPVCVWKHPNEKKVKKKTQVNLVHKTKGKYKKEKVDGSDPSTNPLRRGYWLIDWWIGPFMNLYINWWQRWWHQCFTAAFWSKHGANATSHSLIAALKKSKEESQGERQEQTQHSLAIRALFWIYCGTLLALPGGTWRSDKAAGMNVKD